jgi:hypothetical protein
MSPAAEMGRADAFVVTDLWNFFASGTAGTG